LFRPTTFVASQYLAQLRVAFRTESSGEVSAAFGNKNKRRLFEPPFVLVFFGVLEPFKLKNLNVLGLPTLGALGHVELDRLTLLKSAEPVRLNRSVMDKNILTVCAAQKAKPLSIVKPLYCTLFHLFVLP
jgi:hypothetical protein